MGSKLGYPGMKVEGTFSLKVAYSAPVMPYLHFEYCIMVNFRIRDYSELILLRFVIWAINTA